MWIWLIVSMAIVVLDQISKFLVEKNISDVDTIKIIEGVIDFVNVKNTGAAFSIFNNSTGFLAFISIAFCVGIIIYWIKEKPTHKLYCAGISLMFGGALGNGIDRIFRGEVVDFIKTVFMDFPVFNVADIAIVIGAVISFIYLIFIYKDEEKNGNNSTQNA